MELLLRVYNERYARYVVNCKQNVKNSIHFLCEKIPYWGVLNCKQFKGVHVAE